MLRGAAKDADDINDNIIEFGNQVRDWPGQAGALFRQITHVWSEFCAAEQLGGTTQGEEVRLRWVLAEAMELWRLLNQVEGL